MDRHELTNECCFRKTSGTEVGWWRRRQLRKSRQVEQAAPYMLGGSEAQGTP